MPIPRRILFINDYLNGGGAEVVMHQLKEGLESLETPWKTQIFCGSGTAGERAGNPFGYVYSFRYRRELTQVLEQFKPDVVHLLNYYHILSPSVLGALKKWKKRLPGVKVVYTAHDFHLLSPSSGLTAFSRQGKLYRLPPERISGGIGILKHLFTRWDHRGRLFSLLKLFQWFFAYGLFFRKEKVFDVIISPGEFMLSALLAAFPEIPGKLIRNPYTHPPEAVPVFEPLPEGEPVRAVFAGRLGQEKGLREFISSAVPFLGRELVLDIYGSGPEQEALSKLIREHDLELSCRLKGALSHGKILQILSSYHVLVLPSLWFENAPLSLVEGAFNGLYLLVSEWGGVAETARFCGGAFFMDPRSQTSVQQAVLELSKSVHRKGSPKRDRNRLESAYSYTLFLKEHLEVYGNPPMEKEEN